VVFLHHGLGSVHSWRHQIPAFVAAGWRTLAFDRWGYGRSTPRPAFAPDFLQSDAEETIQLLDALEVRRAAFVGHSDGGTIALIVAGAHPDLVSRMAVVAAHAYYEPREGEGVRGIAAAAQEAPLKDSLDRHHAEKARVLVEQWTQRWLRPEMRDLSLLPALAQVRCPTLVVQGELDEHASPQHARDIAAALPMAELWLIPGAQHMVPHDQANEFNARVLAFLEPARLEGGAQDPMSEGSSERCSTKS
jgi:pimeloyl-ACP methyl ester carboxylesterase